VGEVTEGVGKKKGRSGKEGVRRGGGICAIGFREDGRPCAETQINRQEDHFHCTSLYPRVPKMGKQFSLYPPVPPGPKSGGTMSPTPSGCAAHAGVGEVLREAAANPLPTS